MQVTDAIQPTGYVERSLGKEDTACSRQGGFAFVVWTGCCFSSFLQDDTRRQLLGEPRETLRRTLWWRDHVGDRFEVVVRGSQIKHQLWDILQWVKSADAKTRDNTAYDKIWERQPRGHGCGGRCEGDAVATQPAGGRPLRGRMLPR
ncbi:unnamed protein product [Vitrella brassicaformis CCMP3155]|uniref:Uncharacterized protein n=1 Tax=Vitrella brassicaformis (strain CCMP3155) TaxID=1169540 RepID=A0A0G4GGX6_VITBC|nr:unnamed protein product [Vitrella brassicaformis CCMP3155]|eukprot:CEM28867.1 unnamed protein product [Vitrella brassicaformis CCMP3155]